MINNLNNINKKRYIRIKNKPGYLRINMINFYLESIEEEKEDIKRYKEILNNNLITMNNGDVVFNPLNLEKEEYILTKIPLKSYIKNLTKSRESLKKYILKLKF